MGKVTISPTMPAEVKRTPNKDRPIQNSLPMPHSHEAPTSNSFSRRSTRRNPKHSDSPSEFDDEIKEKKVKLVVRLPQLDDDAKFDEKNHHQLGKRHFQESYSGSGSDRDSENRNGFPKKRKIISVGSGSGDDDMDRDKEDVKAADTLIHGSLMDLGPGTPLPDKKLLVFILDRLQKKDTYGVFSEPVDPEELPDYFDIIKKPMDFRTVRQKLDDGIYKNVEGLEADLFLICSNAMQYNASDTIYYRQARSIHDLAKRDFANLRHEGEDGAPQPKIVRRGRPPNTKNQKKPAETGFVDRLAPELSSTATLANDGKTTASNTPSVAVSKNDNMTIGSNYHNLRRTSSRFRPTDMLSSSSQQRYGDSEWSANWNTEFPASILRADMKYGSKQYAMDENRRDTYTKCSRTDRFRMTLDSVIDTRQLVPVGVHEALGYARSLARYAGILGPVAWRMASKKIEAILPSGVRYGPGWVGESPAASSQGLSFSSDVQKSHDTVSGDCNSTRSSTSSSLLSMSAERTGKAVEKSNVSPYLHTPYRNGFTRSFIQSQGREVPLQQTHLVDAGHVMIKSGTDEYNERNEKLIQESEKS